MLDAFIIDKIRRDRASKDQDQREQLRIEMPRLPGGPVPSRGRTEQPDRSPREHDDDGPSNHSERGVVIVDFTI